MTSHTVRVTSVVGVSWDGGRLCSDRRSKSSSRSLASTTCEELSIEGEIVFRELRSIFVEHSVR
jgi:hypothetical protein